MSPQHVLAKYLAAGARSTSAYSMRRVSHPSRVVLTNYPFRTYCSAPVQNENAKAEPKPKAQEPRKVEPPHHESVKLNAETEKLIAEKDKRLKDLKDELLYALADAQNARKIAAEDVSKAKEFGIKEFAKDMVEVVDCLENAVGTIGKLNVEDTERLKHVSLGISMTLSVMLKNLERHGVNKINLKTGDVFDYNYHEALYNHPIKAEEKFKDGQVAAIVKTGYMIGSRILRASKVGVAQKAESPEGN
mmetsp:Transcript_20186/g.27848  ORF Transcript_20186/g.27848 Transcript_20186/m.27848 type:complete len:247 (+) Transcript_20186:58-798(+)|eukprot:CAMPEP_0201489532 /NCGR_PEP_ID=MMETSP0151_2-20130828/22863_1 /ASSEMBLY_ACC=CAM_ASM_000257 /TAXON_ID=200890 /ORGANISM="Paramoeba atlantica, Strain 621/1 / CCAP 1560/9" /LENGTH=246 /DNA_ID=CAMNT_0047875153 /DNA_START=40 /DNA_END=780 /DNA_ORIENTATION=+